MQFANMLSRILFILGCLGVAIVALPTESDPPTLYRTVGYYTEWAQYARKFPPYLIKENQLTHMLYAFANIRSDTGEVNFVDDWGATQVRYTDRGDSWNHNDYVYGNVKQLFLKKQANRKLKNLLSIGGWGSATKFVQPASSEQGRQKFAESSVKLLADNGFDGLDIDWEYPENDEEARNWVLLLEATRKVSDSMTSAM
jgi:chitinase